MAPKHPPAPSLEGRDPLPELPEIGFRAIRGFSSQDLGSIFSDTDLTLVVPVLKDETTMRQSGTPKVPNTSTGPLSGQEPSTKLTEAGAFVDSTTQGALSQFLLYSGFTGNAGATQYFPLPPHLGCRQVIVAGLGTRTEQEPPVRQTHEREGDHPFTWKVLQAGGAIAKASASAPFSTRQLVFLADDSLSLEEQLALVEGFTLRSYRFFDFFSDAQKRCRRVPESFTLVSPIANEVQRAFSRRAAVCSGVFLTRRVVTLPGNILNPDTFCTQAEALSDLGVDVDCLDHADLEKLGMHALLGVAKGSRAAPFVVSMRHNGLGRTHQKVPLVLVGKGVTFDSGGLSLKPAAGMEGMKWDMAGAGTVLGVMHALAERKAKVNVVGLVGLVENMPDGNAQRPGDVVLSMKGKTIEVLNTDAEGRLVLADVLTYAQRKYKPEIVIDLATLTGAMVVALGNEYAGMFSNAESLAASLLSAGRASGDRLWRLPLDPEYEKLLRSDIADLKNIGNRWAGAITAAEFLYHFIEPNVQWAHIDIAGVAWRDKATNLHAKGATGFGVRLLERYIADQLERS